MNASPGEVQQGQGKAMIVGGAQASASEPVTRIPTDALAAGPKDGIALCLSGGGYRAMLFHLGAAWRLNELRYLPKLDWIASVSGGAMAAGMLGRAWSKLTFDSSGRASNFAELVTRPIRELASRRIDVWAVGLGWLGLDLAWFLRSSYGGTTLRDLPDRPRIVLNASNVQSGALWRFTKFYAWDWRVGKIDQPQLPLATAVAASASFPPFLSPMILRFRDSEFVPGSGSDLQYPPFTERVFLTDGGVYDNLGLETAWKQYKTVLVSDGSRRPATERVPARNWFGHALRVQSLIHNQVASVRKRQLIQSFGAPDANTSRDGTYWGIGSDIKKYDVVGALPCLSSATERLATTPTRLWRFAPRLQEQLINWGYAICDAAMRRHVVAAAPAPDAFPYPQSGVT